MTGTARRAVVMAISGPLLGVRGEGPRASDRSPACGPALHGPGHLASLAAGRGEHVSEIQDSVVVGFRVGEGELGGRAGVGEQPLPGAKCQRVDEQVRTVDQAVGEQRPDQAPRRRVARLPRTPIMPMLWLCRQAHWVPCVATWCG